MLPFSLHCEYRKEDFGFLEVDRRIIVTGMRKTNMTDSKCKDSPASGHVTMGGFCEYGHETSGFTN
jgi:hypothetical protein